MEKSVLKILKEFLQQLEEKRIPYAVIGGIAVGHWAEQRYTKDIDLTIALDKEQWKQLHETLRQDATCVLDAINQEVGYELPYLIRLHYNGQAIDLLPALTEYQNVLLSRSIRVPFDDGELVFASAEDIIVCKLIAGRPQDLVDIRTICLSISDLDRAYIGEWAQSWDVAQRWQELQS